MPKRRIRIAHHAEEAVGAKRIRRSPNPGFAGDILFMSSLPESGSMADPNDDPRININLFVHHLVKLFKGKSNDEIDVAVSMAKDEIAKSRINRNKPVSWRDIIADC